MSIFKNINSQKPSRNTFDLSHERKFSMNMGELIPILTEEVVPGDSWKVNTETLMRLAPMVAPVMHRVNVYTHFFFVPNRIVWDNWEDFITGGEDGNAMPLMPTLNIGNHLGNLTHKGSLLDYMGAAVINSVSECGSAINALPFRAYLNIFNEYYRDQNLQTKIPFDLGDGDTDPTEILQKRIRAWEKDYFTSALPFTQKGGEVTTPLSGAASVVKSDSPNLMHMKYGVGGGAAPDGPVTVESERLTVDSGSGMVGMNLDPNGTLEADMSSVTAASIEELRRASRLQEWLEKNARGGSRYIESILSHFGVKSSDARLQRPEYLGGGKNPVVISEVLNTTGTDGELPQGNMSGHGISAGSSNSFSKTFEEHGYIIGIMSVLPKTTYQQGTRRHLLKNDKFQYFWPEFAHLGEQEVLNAELFATYCEQDEGTFGYQSRYAEYKNIPSTVHGDFKEDLAYWHMGRIFESLPALNEQFIKSDPTHRIFAVEDPSSAKLYVQVYNRIRAIRPMPTFGTPRL